MITVILIWPLEIKCLTAHIFGAKDRENGKVFMQKIRNMKYPIMYNVRLNVAIIISIVLEHVSERVALFVIVFFINSFGSI